MEHKVTIEFIAPDGPLAAVAAANITAYAHRQGVTLDRVSFDPPLPPSENDDAEVITRSAMPQNWLKRGEGESEEEFSDRAAREQSDNRELRLTGPPEQEPTRRFLGAFGDDAA